MATLEHRTPSRHTTWPGVCPTCERRMRRLNGYADRCPVCGTVAGNERRAELSLTRVFGNLTPILR